MSAAAREAELRRRVVDACRAMNTSGINQGTSGNISARLGDAFLITPSAVPYDELRADDLVLMTLDGAATGERAPSTEWRIHRDVLRARPEAEAVVHAHPPFATALACLRRDIPPFHYMVAVAGGATIRCAPYATFGSQELSDHALAALDGRRACLLANHGILAFGSSVASALALAVEVEALAGQYLRALSVGEPALLDDDEMARVVEKFRTYGRDARANQSTR